MSEARNQKRKHLVRVFVSHSAMDAEFARKVREALFFHRANARVFTTGELSAGEKWEPKLRNELAAADVVVAILTPNSSNWVLQEIGAAWALEKPIILVVTRRSVLNQLSVPMERATVLELEDFEGSEGSGKFVRAFEDSLAAAHVSI